MLCVLLDKSQVCDRFVVSLFHQYLSFVFIFLSFVSIFRFHLSIFCFLFLFYLSFVSFISIFHFYFSVGDTKRGRGSVRERYRGRMRESAGEGGRETESN